MSMAAAAAAANAADTPSTPGTRSIIRLRDKGGIAEEDEEVVAAPGDSR